MTATDELRAMLDERDVEWEPSAIPLSDVTATFWIDCNGNVCSAVGGTSDLSYSMLSVQANFTPAQAIAATMGDNDATRARQDGAGTCRITVQDNMAETEGMGDVWLECDTCGFQMPLEPSTPRFNFCPNCGRRVVEE